MTVARPAIGIDLGTTFSVVAHVDDTGRPATIPNSEGDLLTPTVVYFDEGTIVVGKEAQRAALLDPARGFQFVKREMGKPVCAKPLNGEFLPPEVVQSLVLEKLKRDAEAVVGPIDEVVITVPAYFNEPRRKATQDAGRLAGLNVIDIINEPTAAAIAFGVREGFLASNGESRREETVLVFDLGGGTFDVTLMRIDGKNYTVVATDGNFMLGGIDWDERIVRYLADEFQEKQHVDLRNDVIGLQRLRREAEDAKRALSSREKLTISFEHAGQGIRIPFTRQQFDSLTEDLVERTRFTVNNMLRQANTRWDEVTRILLVGGSTRMPAIVAMLHEESGMVPDRSLSADEAVAHGAAIYSRLLRDAVSRKNQVSVSNVTSHDLGVLGIDPATKRPSNKVMIGRNTELPATKTAPFSTRSDGQRSVLVDVIEGGDASGNHSTPIGRCVIRDLPPNLPAGTPVEVTFSYAPNGRLQVHARIPRLDKQARLDIERASGLSDDQINGWSGRLRNGLRPLNLE